MSIRIYALAKQLQVESKILVDLCKQIGLDGKGSALASLTDEEVEQVKQALPATGAIKGSAGFMGDGAIAPMQKPSLSLHNGKIPVLKPTRPVRPEEKEQSSVTDSAAPQTTVSPTEDTASLSASVPTLDITESVPSQVGPEEVATPQVEEVPQIQQQAAGAVPQLSLRGGILPARPGKDRPETSPQVVPATDQTPPPPTATTDAPVQTPAVEATPSTEQAVPVSAPEVVTPSVSAPLSPVAATPPLAEPEKAAPPVAAVEQSVPTPPVLAPVVTTPTLPRKPAQPEQSAANSAAPETKPAGRAPATSPAAPPKKKFDTPLSSRREETRQQQPQPQQPEPTPVSFEEAARLAAIEEMKKRPPVLRPTDEKIHNLDSPKKKKNDSDGSKQVSRQSKPGVSIHLAPMPTAPTKPTRKQPKEETAQQPTTRFKTPEELRAAMSKTQASPLSGMIEQAKQRNQSGRRSGQDTRMPSAGGMTGDRGRRDQGQSQGPGQGQSQSPGQGPGRDKGSRRPPKQEPFFTEEATTPKRGTNKKGKARGDAEVTDEGREKRPRVVDTKRFRDEMDNDSSSRFFSRRAGVKKGKPVVSTAPRKGDIVIEMPCTLKQFAEATGLSAAVIIKKCIELGRLITINQPLDQELAELLVMEFDLKAVVKKAKTLEEEFFDTALEEVDPPESLKPRPPVVTFLGHVDHGKTSLLDRILKLDVVSGEKGGITQHIRAYRIGTPSGDVTFVDTPGHEAFTAMRARGANCTDIAVLVVAADDGVMPQTEEAISHAKAAGVPIVVALNKMDLPGVHRDRVIQELASNDLMPSEWGGDVEIVETSAVTGMGIDELLQTLLTIAELRELKANPNRPATGVVLEAAMFPGQGVVCKALVENGTLRPGDVVLCGNAYGRVKVMFDTLDANKHIDEAGPSTPVSLLGLDVAPGAGSKFVVLDDISAARQIAEDRTKRFHESELADVDTHVTLENLFERISGSKTQQVLNIIVRADVRGSIEAIRKELSKLEHPEVKLKILQASVGGVTEADVHLANASDAIIVGFNVVPDEGARTLAEQQKVQVRRYDIIYKLTEDIKAAIEGMLKPVEQVKELGRVAVQRVFSISRVGNIAGCRVVSGVVERDARVRLIRDSRIIGEYVIDTLKREKDDAREVRTNQECGIKLKNFNDIKEGDLFEVYKIEEVARTF